MSWKNGPLLLVAALCCACSSTSTETEADADTVTDDTDADADREPIDADQDSESDNDADTPSCEDMSDNCASEFGSLFTRANGRADGTLLALLETTDTQCPLYNDDHVVLQMSILGHVQRLVVSVDEVAVHRMTAPLYGPEFEEGWHTGMELDYPTHLGVRSTDFDQASMEDAMAFICAELEVGAPLSVYAYTDGEYPASAHQIHRNDRYPDGAIVARPTSDSPTYLLFRYRGQDF